MIVGKFFKVYMLNVWRFRLRFSRLVLVIFSLEKVVSGECRGDLEEIRF